MSKEGVFLRIQQLPNFESSTFEVECSILNERIVYGGSITVNFKDGSRSSGFTDGYCPTYDAAVDEMLSDLFNTHFAQLTFPAKQDTTSWYSNS